MQRFPGESKRKKEMTASINAANFLMLSVFGIAAVGYLLGRITIKGISLGTAGVFVIALVYGAFFGTHFNSRFVIEEINYASQALKIIENLGLVFFVTSVGFIAGPNFFKNMKHNFKSCAAGRGDHPLRRPHRDLVPARRPGHRVRAAGL